MMAGRSELTAGVGGAGRFSTPGGAPDPLSRRAPGRALDPPAREVTVPGRDGHGLPEMEVVHVDGAALDDRQRAVAPVLRDPLGAAHGCRTELAARLELAVLVGRAQRLEHLLARLRGSGDRPAVAGGLRAGRV